MKIDEDDLPSLFQLTIAQESNSNQLESLHTLFEKQQQEIDIMRETIGTQHEILVELTKRIEGGK